MLPIKSGVFNVNGLDEAKVAPTLVKEETRMIRTEGYVYSSWMILAIAVNSLYCLFGNALFVFLFIIYFAISLKHQENNDQIDQYYFRFQLGLGWQN